MINFNPVASVPMPISVFSVDLPDLDSLLLFPLEKTSQISQPSICPKILSGVKSAVTEGNLAHSTLTR